MNDDIDKENGMILHTEGFMINNYGKQSTFTSFLPGISGIHGIPIWCFYVNRGQGISSFGIQDKDHAIMEFYPAHQAYQNVKRTGFRTFLKINNKYIEPFSNESKSHKMNIFMNSLEIEEVDKENEIKTNVVYYSLPGEKVGALVRKLTLRNLSSNIIDLEVLDGMPALIPYGVDMISVKGMGQTIKAWMQVEDIKEKLPYYRVRLSTDDLANVSQIEGGNFSFACFDDGERLSPIVDPNVIFSYDTSLSRAVGFIENGIDGLLSSSQTTQNEFPCSFYGTKCKLGSQEEISIYHVIGQVASKNILYSFMKGNKNKEYFNKKRKEVDLLTKNLCRGIETKTASKEFDEYCKQTYLDNILRGGYPIKIGKNTIFYTYGRKHGDPERDYNYFTVDAEFYSQGNGNYRDINQNRRCDTFFAPFVGKTNIKKFYSLIQLDGYNPLLIEKETFVVDEKTSLKLLEDIIDNYEISDNQQCNNLIKFLSKPFTPGSLYKKLTTISFGEQIPILDMFEKIISSAQRQINDNFGEGYWSDHWTYNLDLIEEYLEIFPEDEEKLLFEQDYTYFLSQIKVNPRRKRYVKTDNGIRQYNALDEDSKRQTKEKLVRSNYGNGEVIYSSLMEKLILLCVSKFSTLDAYGMGVEMEGGKPGWYDALNGLPGVFGSSMAETYELARYMNFTIKMLRKYPHKISLLDEISDFVKSISSVVKEEKDSLLSNMEVISFWNKANDVKEAYREKVYSGVSGKVREIDSKILVEILEEWYLVVKRGIEKACSLEKEICPTYFAFNVTDYEENDLGIFPKHFEVIKIPLFLEGPVRYLKLDSSREEKVKLYNHIKNSDLYDIKLSMYKVNASLKDASYELGRAKAFTPGWLENESIWLHMEYKYLLELLKSGLYKEFFKELHNAAIPFLDPKVYGRSIYENSSFIASSSNPNSSYHGKGFVTRLSGSTIEFVNMWKIMMFGRKFFYIEDDELRLKFEPAIPSYLINGTNEIIAKFLSDTTIKYKFNNMTSLIPGEYKISYIECLDEAGNLYTVNDSIIKGELAVLIRKGKMSEVCVYIENNK